MTVTVQSEQTGTQLNSVAGLLTRADERLQAGVGATAAVWPTGFSVLDTRLNGGMRAGELILLAGQQGLGKTTLALQVMRNVVAAGGAGVFFSFEIDGHALLERLIAMEAASAVGPDAVPVDLVRELFSADADRQSLEERMAMVVGGREAMHALDSYGDRLLVHRSSVSSTSLHTVRQVVEEVRARTGQFPFVVIDYLQKVQAPDGIGGEDERVTAVVQGLKDLAIELGIPVFAIVAADKEGIAAGKRMRVQHLRGSSALAYEADVVLVMNNKAEVVARHHLMYDLGNAERFSSWVVVSIEKNRNGVGKVDVEFLKKFQHSRFDDVGRFVAETLVDERVFVE